MAFGKHPALLLSVLIWSADCAVYTGQSSQGEPFPSLFGSLSVRNSTYGAFVIYFLVARVFWSSARSPVRLSTAGVSVPFLFLEQTAEARRKCLRRCQSHSAFCDVMQFLF
jgi:hypothetical protein